MSFKSWNYLLFAAKVIRSKGKIADQTDERSCEKMKSREETEQPGGFGAATAVAATTVHGVHCPGHSAASRTRCFGVSP